MDEQQTLWGAPTRVDSFRMAVHWEPQTSMDAYTVFLTLASLKEIAPLKAVAVPCQSRDDLLLCCHMAEDMLRTLGRGKHDVNMQPRGLDLLRATYWE